MTPDDIRPHDTMTIGELAALAATHPAPHRGMSKVHRRRGREFGIPPCCIEFFTALSRRPFLTMLAVEAYWCLVRMQPYDGREYIPCPGCLGRPLDTVLTPAVIAAGRRAADRDAAAWAAAHPDEARAASQRRLEAARAALRRRHARSGPTSRPPRPRAIWTDAHQAADAAGQLQLLEPPPGSAGGGTPLAQPEKGSPMTTATDLSGSWSVADFYRACESAHVDLDAFHLAWVRAWLTHPDHVPHAKDCPITVAHRHESYGPLCTARGATAPHCGIILTACLPLPPACGPALVACGALPPGWPEAAAQRLVVAMIKAKEFHKFDRPAYSLFWGPQPYRDTVFTDAEGRIVYRDGFDDLRAWMEALGFEEEDDPYDPPGSLRPLVEYVSLDALTDRIGPDRMAAFVTKLREEGPGPGPGPLSTYYYFRKAAVLGRYAGLKFENENVTLLAQADRDMAEACTGEARAEAEDGVPPRPDDSIE